MTHSLRAIQRRQTLLLPGAAGILACVFSLTTGRAAAQAKGSGAIVPTIVCGTYDPDDGLVKAILNAYKSMDDDQFILVGSDNAFSPYSQDQGQPNFFPSGESADFVVVYFPEDDSAGLHWHLQTYDLTVSQNTITPCRASYFKANTQLALNGPGTYPSQFLGEVTLAGYNPTVSVTSSSAAVSVNNVQVNATPPAGLTASNRSVYLYGDITVAPGPAASTTLLVNAVQAGQQLAFGMDQVTTSGSAPNTAGCATDVTAALALRSNKPTQLIGTDIYTQLVMVQNTGGKPITSAIQLALTNLSPNARLFNATGTGTCPAIAGAAYVTLTNGIAPAAYASVVLVYTNSMLPSAAISYTPVVLAGGSRL